MRIKKCRNCKSEKLSREIKPDYYLALSRYFEKEILKKKSKIISGNIKFIFAFPKPQVYK